MGWGPRQEVSREEGDQSGCCTEDEGRVRKLREELAPGWWFEFERMDGDWAPGCSREGHRRDRFLRHFEEKLVWL